MSPTYRVVTGWSAYEDFPTLEEAKGRANRFTRGLDPRDPNDRYWIAKVYRLDVGGPVEVYDARAVVKPVPS